MAVPLDTVTIIPRNHIVGISFQICFVVASISCFQKGAYYGGIKMFSINLPRLQSVIPNKEKFKVTLQIWLGIHTCWVGEFLIFENNL
jgi:hypothetical protein